MRQRLMEIRQFLLIVFQCLLPEEVEQGDLSLPVGLAGKFVFATPEVYATPVVSKQYTYCSTIVFNVSPRRRSLA